MIKSRIQIILEADYLIFMSDVTKMYEQKEEKGSFTSFL